MTRESESLLCFCHIVKAAGTTFSDILRRNYGIAHLDVEPTRGSEIYRQENLVRDLRLLPWVSSLAGHGLRPYVDYGEYGSRMQWITWLRDPLDRLLSGYQHGVEKNGLRTPFEIWLTEPGHRNRQVLFLAGDEDDIEGAKAMLASRFVFTGIVEQFDASLDRLADLALGSRLDLSYMRRSNTARRGEVARQLRADIDRYSDLIEHNIAGDRELYRWALAQFGSASGHPFKCRQPMSVSRAQFNLRSNYLFRHTIYKPFIARL